MATLRYYAGAGAEVSFTTLTGETRVACFDASGHFSTSDAAEMAALDALADSPGSPVAHADKQAARTPKTTTEDTATADTSEDTADDADR